MTIIQTSRTIRRRSTAAAVLAAAVAIAMTGCSTSTTADTPGGTTKITTLSLYSGSSPAGKWLNGLSADFEKANPGIDVSNDFVAQTDLPTTYGKSIVAGNEQDIVMTNLVGDPTTWLQNGATVDVKKYLKSWGLDATFSKSSLQAWTNAKGQLQAFPLEGYNWPMWYNMGLLEKAGIDTPPTTWDELIADSAKLRDIGVQPFAVGAADYPAPAVITLVGLAKVGEKRLTKLFTTGDWSGADGQEVIDGMLQLRDAGVFDDDSAGMKYPDQVAAFGAGKAAMLFDGSWGYGNAASSFGKLDIRLGGFPLPSGSPVDKPISFAGQSTGVWISPNGVKKADAVKKFVQYMYAKKNLTAFANLGYVSPAKTGTLDLDTKTLPALNVASQEQLPEETSVFQPTYNSLSPTVTSAFFRASTQAFVKGATAAQITQSLEQAWQAN